MEQLLKVNKLIKYYGDKKVVNELSFEINKGEILCLLGPNGAGKSTTINIICGLLNYEKGDITWLNNNVKKCLNKFKKELGVVPQDLAIYEDLSAQKNVRFFASLYGLKGEKLDKAVDEALSFVGLLARKDDKASTFSGGMKRRLNIACAIAHKPSLLIMDEPTVGIDPQSRNHILNSIKKLKQCGMTILYTTHYMEEVEEISERILIMDNGSVIAKGTKESLKEELFDERQYVIKVNNIDCINFDEFYSIDGVKNTQGKDDTVIISCINNIDNLEQIISLLMRQKIKINNIFCLEASLENVFLKLTGKSLRD